MPDADTAEIHVMKNMPPPITRKNRDYDRLLKVPNDALAESDDEKSRTIILKGFKEWFWHNNITLDYIFL